MPTWVTITNLLKLNDYKFFSYLLTFVCFDLMLFIYTMDSGGESSLDDYREGIYNLIFVIIIIVFLVITAIYWHSSVPAN